MVSMIVSSTHGESHKAWKRVTNNISKRKYTSHFHRKGLSIYSLSDVLTQYLQYPLNFVSDNSLDGLLKECFLDLGLFPSDRKICADALLDIWVYVRKLQRNDAFALLSQLESRNLINLTCNSRGSTTISDGNRNASELYFSQRDGVRDLALYSGHHDNILHRQRLVIERKNSASLKMLRNRAIASRFLSILTGPMEESDWYDMNFPETEVLLLFFDSTEYFLPPFLKSMKNLKFLMISNCGTNKARVKGLDVLSSLTQLKSVRLERLISPFGGNQSIEALRNIEKLSLSLCEGFEYIPTFTKLQDFNLDHSNDLGKLFPHICSIPTTLSCSITNCHQLQNLPSDFGNMKNLRMLWLSALPRLEQLPASIGKLEQMEYLDISLCEGLKELPKEIGQLKKLRELDMRECSRLTSLPAAVSELTSLKLVTCDKTIGKQWLRVKNTCIRELRVEIVEEEFKEIQTRERDRLEERSKDRYDTISRWWFIEYDLKHYLT